MPEGSVEFGLDGSPDALIAVMLGPLEQAGPVIEQMAEAIRQVLRARAWRAGHCRAGLLWCDADTHTLGDDSRVLGVLGPFRSAETTHVLADLNQAGLAIVSASNTYVPLTTIGPSYEPEEPECYTPSGKRTFVRLFPNDYHESVALVELVAGSNLERPCVLHDGEVYGRAVAEGFQRAAPVAGVRIVGSESWRDVPEVSGRLAAAGADSLVMCGAKGNHSVRLLLEAAGALGGAHLFCADAFMARSLSPKVQGTVVVAPGLRPGFLPPSAEAMVGSVSQGLGVPRSRIEPYAIHAAEATELLLNAIAAANGSRAEVVATLFATEERAGLLGRYTIGPTGELTSSDALLGFSVYRATRSGQMVLERGIVPRAELIAAAHP